MTKLSLLISTLLLFSFLARETFAKEVELKWHAINGAAKYNVEVSRDDSFSNKVFSKTVKTNAYEYELKSGIYYLRVQGVDQLDRSGKWSKPFKMVVTAPIASQEKEKEESISFVKKAPKLDAGWKSTDVTTGYKVIIEKDGKEISNTETKTPTTDFQPKEPGEYVVKVRAGFQNYYGPPTVIKQFKVERSALEAPKWEMEGSKKFRTVEKVTLNWNDVPEADQYRILIKRKDSIDLTKGRDVAAVDEAKLIIVDKTTRDSNLLLPQLPPGRYVAMVESKMDGESARSVFYEFDIDRSKPVQFDRADFVARYLTFPIRYNSKVAEVGSEAPVQSGVGGGAHLEGTFWLADSQFGVRGSGLWSGFTVNKVPISYNDMQLVGLYRMSKLLKDYRLDVKPFLGARAWTMPIVVPRISSTGISSSTSDYEILSPSMYGPVAGVEVNLPWARRWAVHFRSAFSVPLYNTSVGTLSDSGVKIEPTINNRTEAGLKYGIGGSVRLLALAGYTYDQIRWTAASTPSGSSAGSKSSVTISAPTLSLGLEASDDGATFTHQDQVAHTRTAIFTDFILTGKYSFTPMTYSADLLEKSSSTGPSRKQVYSSTSASGSLEGSGFFKDSKHGLRILAGWGGFTFGGTTVSYPMVQGQWGWRPFETPGAAMNSDYNIKFTNYFGIKAWSIPLITEGSGGSTFSYSPTLAGPVETIRVDKKIAARWKAHTQAELHVPLVITSRSTNMGELNPAYMSYKGEVGVTRSFTEDVSIGFSGGYQVDQLRYRSAEDPARGSSSVIMSSPTFSVNGVYNF